MEIIMNVDKVTQDFRVIIIGECFYYDDELFMKINNKSAFNFATNTVNDFGEYDRVHWILTKLLVG